jgi:hypothetical protein
VRFLHIPVLYDVLITIYCIYNNNKSNNNNKKGGISPPLITYLASSASNLESSFSTIDTTLLRV